MIVAAGISGDLGTLLATCAWTEIQVVHGDQYASLRRFQAIANVRQSPADNHAHCVRQVTGLHFRLDVRPKYTHVSRGWRIASGTVGRQADALLIDRLPQSFFGCALAPERNTACNKKLRQTCDKP
jgi:hypothetical protein